MKTTRSFVITATVAFAVGFSTSLISEERFDHKVRNDFFAAFNGDQAAYERAMKTTERVLAENPNHAEALVWHGSGLYGRSGALFQSGDREKAFELMMKGIAEMDRAVELEPENLGVRIPRGAVLLTSTRMMPENPMKRSLIEKGVSDYQSAYDKQKAELDTLGEHPKGELLLGLGDGYSRLGDEAKAKVFFDLIAAKMKGTPYAKRAAIWFDKKALPASEAGCIGCHVSK